MAQPNLTIPKISRQPPTVDFIDNHLPQYHPAFEQTLVQYDASAGKYLAKYPASGLPGHNSIDMAPPQRPLNEDRNALPARPDWTESKAMEFWTATFPEAMARFKVEVVEPKGRSETAFDIRNKLDWDAIYGTLESARSKYQEETGTLGWMRKVRRKAADNITPISRATGLAGKMFPNDPYATPVLSALEVLFEAVKTSSRVRKEVLAGFDGLIPIFSDVELFLSTFPSDVRIRNTALDLTVATLDAIEKSIGFFTSNELMKAGKAVLSGADYEKSLLHSLAMIKETSRNLMEEAVKSHIFEFHMYSIETQNLHRYLSETQQTVISGINSIAQLLADHLKQKDRELDAVRKELSHLKVENEMLQSSSPIQSSFGTHAQLPYPYFEPPVVKWHVSQETLRQIIAAQTLDMDDFRFIADKKELIPARQRVQAEQIVNTNLFRNWIVSPSSAKLLVQWDICQPKTVAGVSPLSVFCTTMAQALRANPRFLFTLWFCGLHIDTEPRAGCIGREMLRSLLDQLLRQYEVDTRTMQADIDLAGLQEGRMSDLIKSLDWLVRQLHESTTLFFIVDAVVFFEREEHEGEALEALSTLLRFANDRSISATVKVLFTSTPGTDIVRGVFEEEDLILDVYGLPRMTWAPSEERTTRELTMGIRED